MPLKVHPDGTRELEMSLVVPGTPEQVWHAIATGAGTTAWFTTATIDEREGGELVLDLGPHGLSRGTVTAFQPPVRFAYEERDWAEGAPPVATEITVTGRDNGTCVVRMVHSLFTSSDAWDDQVEGFEGGWPGFFEVLKLYLRHHAGEPAAMLIARSTRAMSQRDAWRHLLDTLVLTGATVGERHTITATPEPLDVEVEFVHQDRSAHYVIARVFGNAPGILFIGTHPAAEGTGLGVCRFAYGAEASAHVQSVRVRWEEWIATTA